MEQNQGDTFLTSVNKLDGIKNSYISLKLNKNIESIEQNFTKLNSAIATYPNMMNILIKGHQQDFHKAYKAQMTKLRKELEQCKEKSATQKDAFYQNQDFTVLQSQLKWFANESTALKQTINSNSQIIDTTKQNIASLRNKIKEHKEKTVEEMKQNHVLNLAMFKGFTNIDELSLIDKYPSTNLVIKKQSRSVHTAPSRRHREPLLHDEHHSFILITLQMLIKARLTNEEVAKETSKLYERHRLKRLDYIELLKEQIAKYKTIPVPKRTVFKESPLLGAFLHSLKDYKKKDVKFSTNGFANRKKDRISNEEKIRIIDDFLGREAVQSIFSHLIENLSGELKSVLAPPRIGTAIHRKRKEGVYIDPLIEEIADKNMQ